MLTHLLFLPLAAQATETLPLALPRAELRYITTSLTDFPVDAEGNSVAQGLVLEQRIRVGWQDTLGALRVSTEWDLLTGQVAGDTWNIPGDIDERNRETFSALSLDGFAARELSLAGQAGGSLWKVGLMTSDWGLGLVANNGDRDALFGRSDFGDRVIRMAASNRPFQGEGAIVPLTFTGAVDLVLADDMARLFEGQRAWQGVVAGLYEGEEGSAGTYVVHRYQREVEAQRSTQATLLDLFAQWPVALGGTGWGLTLAAEAAGLYGRTDRATTYNSRGEVTLLSGAAVAQLVLAPPVDPLRVHLRGGYASGDGNPDDDQSHDFTADRDFDVGMVLFDELMGATEAASHALLSDPDRSGQPPDGVDATVTEGSFRRAVYVQPALTRPLRNWGELGLGTMAAWSTAPISQPFYSYRAGGIPTSHHNTATEGRFLGVEIDWSVRSNVFTLPMGPKPVETGLSLQGGHLWPSTDLAGEGPARVDLVSLAGEASW